MATTSLLRLALVWTAAAASRPVSAIGLLPVALRVLAAAAAAHVTRISAVPVSSAGDTDWGKLHRSSTAVVVPPVHGPDSLLVAAIRRAAGRLLAARAATVSVAGPQVGGAPSWL